MSAWYDNQHITKTTAQSYGEQLETHHLLLPTGLAFCAATVDRLSSDGRAEMPHFL